MNDLTRGNPTKLIMKFALPLFIGCIFQLCYSLADIWIIGDKLGDDSLAAVGSTSTLNDLIVGFLIGLTNGFAVITARYFGAKDEKKMRNSVAGAVMLGLILSLIITVVSTSFLPQILRLVNVPEEHIEEGSSYIIVILFGMTASMLYNVCASVLRAIGDSVTPLIFLIVSVIMNVGLDVLFINVLDTGVSGAAIATVISQSVSAVLCFIYIWRRYKILHLKREDFKISKAMLSELFACGISMGLMQSLVSLGTVILQSAINGLGTNIIVAHTAARKLTSFFMIPFAVFGTTMASYCGQNYGAGEYQRIKTGIRKSVIFSWIWCLGTILMSYTVVPVIIRLITSTKIDEVVETATLYLRIDTLLYFIAATISIYRNALQGIGDHRTPIISSGIELVGKTAAVLCLTPALGYMGIIITEPIVWALMVIPLIVSLHRNPVMREKKE